MTLSNQDYVILLAFEIVYKFHILLNIIMEHAKKEKKKRKKEVMDV